jgi:succinate dehydrogenase / fumarate reductase iron-sulfur subunit
MSEASDAAMKGGPRSFKIWRGDDTGAGELVQYDIETQPGMVVLDAVLQIQSELEPDLAVRWNCKAAKCGSCSAEINGRPALMCKTRLDHLPTDAPTCPGTTRSTRRSRRSPRRRTLRRSC